MTATFRVLGFRVSDGKMVPLVIRVPAPERVPAHVAIRARGHAPDPVPADVVIRAQQQAD